MNEEKDNPHTLQMHISHDEATGNANLQCKHYDENGQVIGKTVTKTFPGKSVAEVEALIHNLVNKHCDSLEYSRTEIKH